VAQESDLLTVLFTDLVGSTALLSALGDDAADELRRKHFSLLREAIGAHRGREIKNLGDGLMVSFSSAREAIACAAAMQMAVSSHSDRLGLRVGIDAGEPINENGDLFGTPVVVARRLCDAADGGQVLVSDIVRMLAGRRLKLELDALGPLALKGLDEPVVAHAVSWQAGAPRIRLCGGLAIEQDGERLDERLPSRQARALFALLLLERERGLTREAIADCLWPDEAPPSRDSSLRALLSGVRRVFGPDSIVGRDNVRLALPAGTTVDVEEAQAALAAARASLERGDHEGAARTAQRAALLTSQELLAGLSGPWIDDRREEQRELSLHALEIEARAALASGRAGAAERAARGLVDASPYRESAHGLLMEALAAGGNVAEATLAYDRLRTLLRDELGTTPAPALVALHDRLLAGDSAPEPAVEAADEAILFPSALERAAERPFVARSDEIERLRQAWAAARGGRARTVLLAGEPGIGKTSLAAQVAREAHDDGGRVLLGRCHSEALVPYEPFVELLRQLPEPTLRPHAQMLGLVIPELASEGGPSPERSEDHATRYLLFDAVARTLEGVARKHPLLLVLEDLHWAESPTLLLLRHVTRAAEDVPLLIVATYRSTEAAGTEQVVSSIASLERDLPLERVTLAGLADDEVTELIQALDGRPSSLPLGTAMRHDTAGNPLFVGQLLRHLDESGALVEHEGELTLQAEKRLGVPESARELVAARLTSLKPDTASALQVAAVIGRTFDPGLVAAVMERPAFEVLDALEAGVASGLVEELDDARQSFVHALVREAIYDGAGAGRRVAMHAAVAESLEAGGCADPAELARHFLAAGKRDKGVEYSVATALRALDRLAYEDAVVHYTHALEALGDSDPQRECDLLLALGDAHARAGDTPAAKRSYGRAAELAEQLSLPEHFARAAVGYGGRLIWEVSRDDPDVRALLERGLSHIGERDGPLRVRLLARLGGGPLRDDHDPTRRREMTSEALAMARRIGDPSTLAYALDGYISAHHSPKITPRQEELAGELIEAALQAGELERAVEAYEHRAAARLELGDAAGAAADVASMAPLADELRQPAQDWFVAERRAVQALHEGRLADAEAFSEEALEIGLGALSWSARVCHVLQLVAIRRFQGRLDEMESAIREAANGYAPSYPVCRCAYIHVLAEVGNHDEARDELAALAKNDFGSLDFDETWLAATAFLAEAAHALGEVHHAGTLYELLSPYPDRLAITTPEVSLGSVPRYLALLAASSGRAELAVEHFEEAFAFETRVGAPAWAALTLADHAVLTGDSELAARAVDAAAELGLDVIARRVAAVTG
jgi:class 3 adenylate cyclase/DNA-binding SARP family transcriptional activator